MDKYGDAGAVRYGIEGAFNVALGKINVNRPNFQEYIRSFLESDGVYSYLHNSCMASTRASLNESNLSMLNVVIPDEDALYIQSGDIGLIIPDETKLDKRFSYYLVSSSVVKKQLDARSQQTKIRHTSPEAIKDCVAFIPIIKEQKKISYLLDCINKKIENNNAINDNLVA